MATVSWRSAPKAKPALDPNYGFWLNDILAWSYGYPENMSANSFEATSSFDHSAGTDVFTGTFNYITNETRFGLVVSPYIESGTITSMTRYYQREFVGSISGLSLDYDLVVAAAKTGSPVDDRAIFTEAFAGNDTFFGSRGSDRFEGFAGNDKIKGGGGADKLYGGTGSDTFIFSSIKDSPHAKGGAYSSPGRDTIFDFSSRQKDKIDLRAVDASTMSGGNNAFKYVGSQDFHKKAGEVRWEKVKGGTYVYGDVNGDGNADLSIYLKNVAKLSKGDFYL